MKRTMHVTVFSEKFQEMLPILNNNYVNIFIMKGEVFIFYLTGKAFHNFSSNHDVNIYSYMHPKNFEIPQ